MHDVGDDIRSSKLENVGTALVVSMILDSHMVHCRTQRKPTGKDSETGYTGSKQDGTEP